MNQTLPSDPVTAGPMLSSPGTAYSAIPVIGVGRGHTPHTEVGYVGRLCARCGVCGCAGLVAARLRVTRMTIVNAALIATNRATAARPRTRRKPRRALPNDGAASVKLRGSGRFSTRSKYWAATARMVGSIAMSSFMAHLLSQRRDRTAEVAARRPRSAAHERRSLGDGVSVANMEREDGSLLRREQLECPVEIQQLSSKGDLTLRA